MEQKLCPRIAIHLFLFLSLLLLAAGPSPAHATALAQAGPLPGSPGLAHPVQTGPASIGALNFTTIVAGQNHTCGLTASGGVKCWGGNYGLLGNGDYKDSSVPVDVYGLTSGVTAISAGGSHTCALLSTGDVECWGRNDSGQLGNGNQMPTLKPVGVMGLTSTATAIAGGGSHTCALITGGGVMCWGQNAEGQLGDGTNNNHTTAVSVSGLSGVTVITAGDSHTCARTTSGAAKCWGSNSSGELGDTTTTNRKTPVTVHGLSSGVTAILAGGDHTCALVSGVLKCWGGNWYGGLGDDTTTQRNAPVNVTGLGSGVTAIALSEWNTCALLTGGKVKCWGDNTYGQVGDGTITQRNAPVDVSGLASGVTAIGAGGWHACALISGAAKCWGNNAYGQLGDGVIILRLEPAGVFGLPSGVSTITAGADHTCALTASGGVKCWGRNDNNQLGDGTYTNRSTPGDVVGLTSGVTAISAGWYHTCVVVSGGVKCWGDGAPSPTAVSGLSGVIAIASSESYDCALLTGGGVKCWGDNSYGQLGDGTTNSSSKPVDVIGITGASAIATGDSHACALVGGGVKCWGDNTEGDLGDGTTNQANSPVNVVGLTGVTAITAGEFSTCAVANGGVKCWGADTGDGITGQSNTPIDVFGLTSGMAAVSAGQLHTCALTAGGAAKCWGYNASGQLGDSTTTERSTPVDVVGLASGATAISAGGSHTCALVGDGRPECWGGDYNGQLGAGDAILRLTPWDVIESLSPSVSPNYFDGQPGSVFSINGSNFPTGTLTTLSPTALSVSINGQLVTSNLSVKPDGTFIFFLDTTGAGVGGYTITVNGTASAETGFRLIASAPLHHPEGGGQTFTIPAGVTPYPVSLVYLPVLIR